MRTVMTISEEFLSGFALAATIAKDPGAEQARAGLCQDRSVVEAWTASARALLTLSKSERRERVRAWLQPSVLTEPQAWPSQPTEPLRAYALLARRSPSNSWPSWLREAPLPRAGFTPDRQLIAVLQRCQARGRAHEGAWDE